MKIGTKLSLLVEVTFENWNQMMSFMRHVRSFSPNIEITSNLYNPGIVYDPVRKEVNGRLKELSLPEEFVKPSNPITEIGDIDSPFM